MRDIYVIVDPYGEIMAIRYLKQEEVDSLTSVNVEEVVQSLEVASSELSSAVDAAGSDVHIEEDDNEVDTEAEAEVEPEVETEVEPEVEKIAKPVFNVSGNNYKNNSKKGKR